MENLDLISMLVKYEGTLGLVLTLSVLIERVSEVIISVLDSYFKENSFKIVKARYVANEVIIKQLITIVIGVVLAIVGNVVLIENLSIPLVVNYIAAGIVASLGSNIVHDLVGFLKQIKTTIKSFKEAEEQIANELKQINDISKIEKEI